MPSALRSATSTLVRAVALAWLVLALLSLAWRGLTGAPSEEPLPPGVASLDVPDGSRPSAGPGAGTGSDGGGAGTGSDGVGAGRSEAGEGADAGLVRVAYREWGLDPAHDDRPTVLLLHGSPGSADNFVRLAPILARTHRVLAPDLPGFGHSDLDVPDVSIVAHAGHVLALLDGLGIARVHAVGYSLGGGVALHMWERAPERVASLTLLSSIGVQEMEWLGDYTLNHALHLLQLSLLRGLDLAIPHFGTTDGFERALLFGRNFAETDQRPLRGLLGRYDGPARVIHGDDDILVPVEAAHEHLRLLPQAEADVAPSAPGWGEADHFMVFRSHPPFADGLAEFLARVDAGAAATRATADPERIAQAARPFDAHDVPPARGPFLWILLALIAIATFASEDLACVGAGLLAAQGRIGFVEAAGAAFVGILVGDLALFLAGRLLGRPAARRAPLKWMLSEAALERGAAWFQKRGGAAIFVSRFTPGLRLPTYVAAGVVGTGFLRFTGWFILAGLAWTPVLVALSMVAGRQVLEATDWVAENTAVSLVIVVAAVVLVTRILPGFFTHAGRRRLLGRWLRLRHWEFWPLWVVYPPVVLWILWLALKHRSLAVVTAVNPGIPAGGVIGESKTDILAQLAGAGDAIPKSLPLPGELSTDERLATLDAFSATLQQPWPVVIKPDAGQRGSGVGVCEDREAAADWLAASPVDMIAQEHVTGAEYGVFWYRLPGADHGEVYSITAKTMPEVVGDGVRSVERLVLDDPRAPAMERAYAEGLGARMADVPAVGERVRLTELGTHCKGAVFEDAGHLASDALRDALDAIAATFKGFSFGRFDLCAPSDEALREGRGLKVLELNGLTSEATHVYDRKHSILTAWRVLCRQWSVAFAIGTAHRAAGVPVTSLGAVLGMTLAYRRDAAQRLS
jgi:pimeloyl-ACP methyl ester carboxylesterase/membrane protein DedA with SNARE-associated domain